MAPLAGLARKIVEAQHEIVRTLHRQARELAGRGRDRHWGGHRRARGVRGRCLRFNRGAKSICRLGQFFPEEHGEGGDRGQVFARHRLHRKRNPEFLFHHKQ